MVHRKHDPEDAITEDIGAVSLLDSVPILSRNLQSPYHLHDLAFMLDRTEREEIRGVSSVATRHGKTTLIGHFIARSLKRNPKREFCFFTFDMDFAGKKNREFRQLSQLAGVRISDDFNTIREWRTKEGGGVFACSVDQHIVGRGFDVIIVDDPLGSFVEAEDAIRRQQVDEAIEFLTTRLHPGGSVIVNASPFHQDDPIARRRRQGWIDVSAPCVIHDHKGRRSLWPERWSLENLDKKRAELKVNDPQERTWSAQWMCDPQPPGIADIGEPTLYTKIPEWNYRIGYGADLAFTQGAQSDWAAFVAFKVTGGKGYVLEVMRTKLGAHMIESTIKMFMQRHGRGPVYSYMSGPEVGFAKMMREKGIQFLNMPARWNKNVRSRRTVERHNAGDIVWPEGAPWLPDVMYRAKGLRFNDKDQNDDEWDALVSVADPMLGGVGAGSVKTLGRPYPGFGLT